MISKKDFIYGENKTQIYYSYKGKEDGIEIIKNNTEKHWIGIYINSKKGLEPIPIPFSENKEQFIKDICIWYNKRK